MPPVIAIPLGDPAGIGPEIALKAALDRRVRAACRPLLIGGGDVARYYVSRLGLPAKLREVALPGEATFAAGGLDIVRVDAAEVPGLAPGRVSAACGRATLEAAGRAVDLALSGDVAGVAAAPHTQAAIAAAGIAFDGYPGFVGARTGADPNGVFLMLLADGRRIVHVTLHVGLRDALDRIDRPAIGAALRAAHAALGRMGIASPRIAVAGINPHAGDGGLFGREEIDIIAPAIEDARAEGIKADGPFGADTMYVKPGYDAFVVMYHDQGHIPAKLAGPGGAAVTIGTPVLFATVAHGSAHDIAGKGVADAGALIRTVLALTGTE